jgi:NADH:ubiquinone oxidoreductase subunit H
MCDWIVLRVGLVLVLMERKVSAYMQIRLGQIVLDGGSLTNRCRHFKLAMKEGSLLTAQINFYSTLHRLLLSSFQCWYCTYSLCKRISDLGHQHRCFICERSFVRFGDRHSHGGWASNNKYSLLGQCAAAHKL